MVLDPNNAQTYSMCGFARALQGDCRAAIVNYNRALDLDHSNAKTYMSRGLAYQQLGNMDLALTDFDQAIALSPDDPFIRLSRLKLYQELGNTETETALADLKHVMEVAPELAEKDIANPLIRVL
ncbi:MAG: tetratricopeptide repeat protein [Chloroflexi bacterium]|nr:tetratricopeptide repeat protein [Chloroflexota bacterium]